MSLIALSSPTLTIWLCLCNERLFFVLLSTTTLFISLLQKGRKEMAREIGKMTFEKIDHKAVNYRRLC